MSRIKIGSLLDASPLGLDLDALLATRLQVQANSGGGKSTLVRAILEATYGKVQQIVLDVEDEFYTLREKFPDYVLARPGGDCPVEVRSADLMARRLLELRASAIISLYELKKHERESFVARFLDAMVNAPKDLWGKCLVVLDEAHIFCPEGGKTEGSAAAVIDLMTRGRKRGFCGVLVTQRVSKLHKDAAAEAINKAIGRTSLDVDMKRAAFDLGFTAQSQILSLRDLKPGNFFVFGPALTPSVTEVRAVEPLTSPPLTGARETRPAAAGEKVRAILAELSDLPAEAEEEARTIEDARERIRDLERKLADSGAEAELTVASDRARVEGFETGHGQGIAWARAAEQKRGQILQLVHDRLYGAVKRLHEAFGVVEESLNDIVKDPLAGLGNYLAELQKDLSTPGESLVVAGRKSGKFDTARQMIAAGVPLHRAPLKPYAPPNGGPGEKLSKCERSILTALAEEGKPLPLKTVRIRAGYAMGGGFKNGLSSLRTAGRIIGSDPLEMTPAGYKALGNFTPLPKGRALFDLWQRRVGKAGRSIMDALWAVPQKTDWTTEEIARASGYSVAGGFKNALSELRTRGVIEGKGLMRLSRQIR
jgi:hypothetical protein